MRAHSNIAHDTCPSRLAIGPPVADLPEGLCSQAARPPAANAASAEGSLGSLPAAAPASAPSLEDLANVHSPDISSVDPAFGPGGFHLAELRLARPEFRHNAGLGMRDNLGVRIGGFVQIGLCKSDEQDGALVGQLGVMHPAHGAVDILDLAPGVVGRDLLQRIVLVLIEPEDLVVVGRSLSQVGCRAAYAHVMRSEGWRICR